MFLTPQPNPQRLTHCAYSSSRIGLPTKHEATLIILFTVPLHGFKLLNGGLSVLNVAGPSWIMAIQQGYI